ncbi:threonine aldolase family protein [Oceanobacillus massiliensis]|uniref:threonine aldolase family protein n=1 Tax=Oceanobacillus massiliensis TaxID=1465765 RepID=UPI00301755DF
MSETIRLKESYNRTSYHLAGHGNRNIDVLKEAFHTVDGKTESDMYGKGQIIENFEAKMARILGTETAVFFPSGTMAQQIALRIWCDEKGLRKVAYHPLSHLEIHEEDGLKELHQIETILLGETDRVITFEDIENIKEDISCILLELPQREIGGQLPSFDSLKLISAYCREHSIKLHLDGARLFEVLPYYGKSAAEVCALFDSVYISFYKGIGGIAGAILAGTEEFIAQSKVWKRRYGGDLISLYPYIIPADYYVDQRPHKMDQYWKGAKELAGYFNSCHGISTVPLKPVSNMFHVHFHYANERAAAILTEVQQATGIGFTSYLVKINEESCYCEISIGDLYKGIPKENLRAAFKLLDEKMKQ